MVRRGEPSVEPNPLPPSPRIGNQKSRSGSHDSSRHERTRIATPRRAPTAPARRATRRIRNDSPYHDHVGRGPRRGDPPHAAPNGLSQPTLLQHQRLHQLSHRRRRERHRSLRHLRLHPPPSLRDGRARARSDPSALLRRGHMRRGLSTIFESLIAERPSRRAGSAVAASISGASSPDAD